MSFDATLPTAKDRIRFDIDDTGPTEFDLADATILALIDTHGELLALAKAARALKVKLSKSPTVIDTDGDIRAEWRDRLKALEDVAAQAEREHRASLSSQPGVQAGPLAMPLTSPDSSVFRF